MDHMNRYWSSEMIVFKESARAGKVRLSRHVNERMIDRDITEFDLMMTILTGRIVEGYDVGQYPNYRNPDPLRVVVGESEGKKIALGIAIGQDNQLSITTCFRVNEGSRHSQHF